MHEQRIEWKKKRAILEPLGVYQDFRAVFTEEYALRPELAKSAKDAEVQVVFSNMEPGIEGGVLFLNPPKQGLDLPSRVAPDNLDRWRRAAQKQKEYAEEVFGAATEAPTEPLAQWDKATAAESVAAFATSSLPDDGISTRAVAFRNTTTHILARDLRADDILASLKQGHAYIAHDWLCDSTGFRFFADNNFGVFEMGDTVGTGLIAGATKITATVSVPAQLKLIRNGVTVLEVNDTKLEFTVREPGAYRLEAWLTADGESRPWIFSNPLYVRGPWDLHLPSMETSPNVQIHRGIVYTGGDPADEGKHKLDLYLPANKLNAPVLVFFHGGNWRNGDRSQYPALGNRLARAGIAVVIPSYRLMPGHPHPAQIEDAAAAFDWVYQHIHEYGGDPKRIYIAGHSSGGHLAALLALNVDYLKKYGLNPAEIRGVIAMSGVYDVRFVPGFAVSGIETDAAKKEASPLFQVHPDAPRFLVSFCQWDYISLPKQARDFTAALKKAFVDAKLLYIPQDNHIAEIINAAKEEGPLLNAILSFVE